jgi:2',3'-cyclic-nucleotide 2'-phosphodiesterase (5'-nucleotidase family)
VCDAACIGNHEFDHGWANMLEQMQEATFPILNGNIFFEGTNELVWNNPYLVIEKGGIKIGLIGLHGKFAFYDTINLKMTQGIEARNEEDYLRKYIAELEPITDIIILSIHQGMPGRQSSLGKIDVERSLRKDIMLAKNVPGIDVIISGHAHQGTPKALVSNGTIIVSTNAYTTELGKLKIKYDTEKDQIISHSNKLITVFDDEIEDDPDMLREIKFWQKEVEKIASIPVFTSTKKLVRAYGKESNMGNLFADAVAATDERMDVADIKPPLVTIPASISCLRAPLFISATSILSSVAATASANRLPIFDSFPYARTNFLVEVKTGIEAIFSTSFCQNLISLSISGSSSISSSKTVISLFECEMIWSFSVSYFIFSFPSSVV